MNCFLKRHVIFSMLECARLGLIYRGFVDDGIRKININTSQAMLLMQCMAMSLLKEVSVTLTYTHETASLVDILLTFC